MGDEFQTTRAATTPAGEAPYFAPGWAPARWNPQPRRRWYNSLWFHVALFLLTILTTLVVGSHIEINYLHNLPAFDWDISGAYFLGLWRHPARLALGVPFSFTLLSILLAHELGHYLTCRHYHIHATYPYFIPAPTLIGTLGAFIRIKSPILNRRELFDVGISGPIAGFIVAIPALVVAILLSKGSAPILSAGSITTGNPLAVILFTKLLRSGRESGDHGFASGGLRRLGRPVRHILESSPRRPTRWRTHSVCGLGEKCRKFSRGLFLLLLPLGYFCWVGWFVWAVILIVLGLRHPLLIDPAESLGRGRKILALVGLLILILTFIPAPFPNQ